MSIRIVRSLPEEEWRRFVEEQPSGNVFHTPEIFDVLRRSVGYEPELWAAASDGRPLALLLPVRVALGRGLPGRLLARSIVYGGALCCSSAEGYKALALLLQDYSQCAAKRTLFTELRHLCDPGPLQRTLAEQGFCHEDHLNYLVDLGRPIEAIFQGIGSRTRKHIRQALRQGHIVIEEAVTSAQVAECYALLAYTYRRAHVPLAHPSLLTAALDVLRPRGMVRFTLARLDGAPVAASVELLYKHVAYGWYGGIDRRLRPCSANELLTWDILRWAAERGYRVYDFGGAGRPGEAYGVRDFKAKFGGTLVNYGRSTLVRAPVRTKLATVGYRLFRRVLF